MLKVSSYCQCILTDDGEKDQVVSAESGMCAYDLSIAGSKISANRSGTNRIEFCASNTKKHGIVKPLSHITGLEFKTQFL